MHFVFSIFTLGRREQGFSLLEVAIVLAIMAVALSVSFPVMNRYMDSKRRDLTLSHIKNVEDALASYVLMFHRLPCPAAGDGHEIQSLEKPGIVPYATLGLRPDSVKDGHGFFLTYAVNPPLTRVGVSLSDGFCREVHCELNVQNADGHSMAPGDQGGGQNVVAFVLVSHGAAGVGSFNADGITKRQGIDGPLERKNNAADLDFVDAPFSLAQGALFRHTVRWHISRNFAGICAKVTMLNMGNPMAASPVVGSSVGEVDFDDSFDAR